MKGYPFGAIKCLERYEEGVVSTLYLCFGIKITNADLSFYTYFFESGILNRDIYGIVQEGARTHGLLNLNLGDFFSLNVPLPSLSEQRAIAAVFSTADGEIETHQRQLDALKTQKKGLMQQLLTGKKRVVIDAPNPATAAAGG